VSLDIVVGCFALLLEDPDEDPDMLDALRQDFATVNSALRLAGLPPHHEREEPPSDLGWIQLPWEARVGHYSDLHFLRRLYAHVLQWRADDGSMPAVLPPPWPGDHATDDPVLQHAYAGDGDPRSPFSGSHLIQHADTCGYYVPVDFPVVLGPWKVPDHALWEAMGSNLGSSQALAGECEDVARLLELDLTHVTFDRDTYASFAALEQSLHALPVADQPAWLRGSYRREAYVCWTLYHGCIASIRTGLALCFG
jgi:hypothetical protein